MKRVNVGKVLSIAPGTETVLPKCSYYYCFAIVHLEMLLSAKAAGL